MDAVMTRLDEIAKTLKELKTENSIIRNEILGIGASVASGEHSMAILENKTLRRIVEETQFQVNAIITKIFLDDRKREIPSKQKSKSGVNQKDATESANESVMEFPVVKIQSKSICEERNWMKMKINEMRKITIIRRGESLQGTTVEAISSTIPFSANVKSSCTIKISNFWDYALTDPQYTVFNGSNYTGPSRICGHNSEVISFVGNQLRCSFLCSFAISRLLRLTFNCAVINNGNIYLGIGFTPANIPTDRALLNTLHSLPPLPDVCMANDPQSKVPLELFASNRNLLVRGHMSLGPRSVVHVELLEISDQIVPSNSRLEVKKRVLDGNSVKSHKFKKNSQGISRLAGNPRKFSCIIEIANCLNVTLTTRTRSIFYCENTDFIPFKVLPFQREIVFGEDKENVEAMFSYDIGSTDYAIVIGVKVKAGCNAFAVAFVQRPAVTNAKELESWINPNLWKTHLHRKYARASDGLQSIQIGNIRADVSMSEEENSNRYHTGDADNFRLFFKTRMFKYFF